MIVFETIVPFVVAGGLAVVVVVGLTRIGRDHTVPGTIPASQPAGERPEIVELWVGRDRTSAAMVVARCEAEGIPVRIIDGDGGLHGAIGMVSPVNEHRILIRADDRDRVEEFLRNQ